jgi:uncharacterized protein (UPF0335 family)
MSNIENVLRQFVHEIEALEERRAAVGDDIKLKYADLKSSGFNPKVVRRLISLRKMDPEKRLEEQSLLEVYSSALGEDLA